MGGGEGGWRKIAELVRPPEAGLPAALQPGRDASGVWIPPSLAPFPAPLPPSLLALLLPPTICRALSPFLRARHPHFLASLGASLLSFPLLPVSELTLRLGILSHRPACSAVPLYSLALLGPSFASQETGETSPPMDSAVEDVSPKSQQAGPSEPPSAPLVLTARDVLVSRPELVIASPPDQQLERRATAPAGLAIADEEVLEQVAAVLRRHPSFAQQITRAYRPGTNPPTPSPRPRRDEAGSWANGRRSGGHRGHNAPLSLRHRNISESDVSGEPSQRGWKKVWRRSFYVITTTALVAISGQVYQERRQRLEYEEQRERLRNDSLTFGQAVRSALTMQSGLILVNMVLAARGVQIWRLIHNLQLVEWVQRIAPAMPVTQKVLDGVRWATIPVRRALRLRSLPGRPIAAFRAHRLAARAAREAMRRKLAMEAAKAAARKRWSILYPLSPVLAPVVNNAQSQARFLTRHIEGSSNFLYRQLGWSAGSTGSTVASAAKGAAHAMKYTLDRA